jgi:hypothetical protein
LPNFYFASLYICVFLINANTYSQALKQPISARYLGLGAYSINHVDVFSFTSNQAALAQLKSPVAGVYGEKRFLLSTANMYTVVFALPTNQGNFGLQADYFGSANYNESQIGIAYARSLGSKLDIGIKFNYYNHIIPGYNNSSAVNFEIGAITHLTDKINAGIHVYNPTGGKSLKQGDEKLTSAYKFGVGYEASPDLFVSAEIIKVEDIPVNVNAGFQYNFLQQFFVRGGIATETNNSYAGAGVSWKKFRLDVSGSYHPQLGFTPGILLIIDFKNKQD